MADKITHLVVTGLERAAAQPLGIPLFAGKTAPGLFTVTPQGRQAAKSCKEQGFLRVVRRETRGKTAQEYCALTDAGLTFLMNQVNPRPVLETLIRSLENRQQQLQEIQTTTVHIQKDLQAFQATVEKVLKELRRPEANGKCQVPGANGLHHAEDASQSGRAGRPVLPGNATFSEEAWLWPILQHLEKWQTEDRLGDCPLPELYRGLARSYSQLTIGQFHDGLRRGQKNKILALHPWTGPLYEMPEPDFALLSGHEVAYYASKNQLLPGE